MILTFLWFWLVVVPNIWLPHVNNELLASRYAELVFKQPKHNLDPTEVFFWWTAADMWSVRPSETHLINNNEILTRKREKWLTGCISIPLMCVYLTNTRDSGKDETERKKEMQTRHFCRQHVYFKMIYVLISCL